MVDAGADERAADLTAPSGLGQPWTSVLHAVRLADRLLDILTRWAAAILLAVEVVLLGSSIVARYVLHRPLIWSDELAVTLFLWFAMLGGTIALRQGQHLRLTTLLNAVDPAAREMMELLAIVLGGAFS